MITSKLRESNYISLTIFPHSYLYTFTIKEYYLAQTVTVSSGKQTNQYINEHDGENISL